MPTGEWTNVYGKRIKVRSPTDIETFMLANDLQDAALGMWGRHFDMYQPLWAPDLAHPAQQRAPPPPPPPAALRVDLVGKLVRKRFPGYGTYSGTIVRINDSRTKYVIKFDGDPNEYEYDPRQIRKMLQLVG